MSDQVIPAVSMLASSGQSQIDRVGQRLRQAFEAEEPEGQQLAITNKGRFR